MTLLPGYELKEVVYRSSRTATYRARRLADDASLLIKVPLEELPSPRDLSRLKQEHALTSTSQLPGVLRTHGLLNYRGGLALLQEDFGGTPLARHIRGRPMEPGVFLRTALRLAETLEALHRHHLLHEDIHPGSILFAPETGETRLTDFGKASRQSAESPRMQPPASQEDALPYLSPEQTGRVNRAVDDRADLYSLGVTFYEMLTGTLPFTAADPLEWAHCHIARQPEPPHLRHPPVPEALSGIVLKLLAKSAEERYQTAAGLKADLAHCLEQWAATGTLAPFVPGRHNIPDRFHLPQRVYGREAQVAELLGAFDSAASGRATLMLVSGYSGIGKSSLVREVHRPVLERRGYFASGKFDQFNRDQPYSALIQAFQELVRQLLTEGDEQVARWRERLAAALGNIGQVIIDVIPEVALITGPQPALPELPSAEAQNRFHLALRNFVQVFTRPEHPLVLFLDDLQWADGASRGMLHLLCGATERQHLLVIGAYRDNEVEGAHPLLLTVRELQQAGGEVRTLQLAPLPESAVRQLLADALHCGVERVAPLAELVWARTHGNPFFLNTLLSTLAREGVLTFDAPQRAWTWDLGRLRALDITDNVADLMRDKVEGLATATRELLQRAACIGNRFDVRTLSVVAERGARETGGGLAEAIEAGLLLPLDEGHRLFNLEPAQLPEAVNAEYKFAHDLVQQAAYALVAPGERARLHRQIGGLLLRHLSVEERERQLFTLVGQLNQGQALLERPEERLELAELNLRAGHKAKASCAYGPALRYLRTGLGLLGEAGWTKHYELTLALHVEATEAAYLDGALEEMARVADAAVAHARTELDKVKVYEVRIRALVARNQLPQAIHTALHALRLLGVHLPPRPGKPHVVVGLVRTKLVLAGKRPEDLAHLPELTDPEKRAVMRLLAVVSAVSFVAMPALFPLIVFKQVELSARHGNTAESSYAYALYAIALAGVLGDVEGGYRFGELALQLVERLGAREFQAKVWMAVYYFLKPWKEPLAAGHAKMLQAYQTGLEMGDLEFAASLINVYAITRYDAGSDLATLHEELAAFTHSIARLKQERGEQLLALMWQTVRNLKGETEEPWRLKGARYDEERMLPLHLKAQDHNALGMLYLQKLVLGYLFRRSREALEHGAQLDKYLGGLTGLYATALHCFYDALAGLAVLPGATPAERRGLQKRLAAHQKKLGKWAALMPGSYLHKLQLVEAEQARVRGDSRAARELYERAIHGAHESGHQNEEALARELTGEFYLSLGLHEQGQHHLRRAHHAYQCWGALAKVRHLEALHPTLLSAPDARPSAPALDLLSITKASQTLSGEIVLERLLKRMMELVLENAGAQRGFLLLRKAGRLVIEAEAEVDRAEVTMLRSLPVDAASALATSVVKYVERTREHVVLEDATRAGLFATDPHLVRARPLSVLCMPVLNQGAVTGLLYLENPRTAGAFTPDRLEVLRLLSGQLAISIENAQHYSELERKVEERTQELTRKNVELEATLTNLKTTQARMIQQEKLASLGHLTAGVAHEIKNPLNFVNNFAQHTSELLEELRQEVSAKPDVTVAEVEDVLSELRQSAAKIYEHGKRADSIVRSMLEHSRSSQGEPRPTQLNALVEQYAHLVHQSTTVSSPNSACALVRDYDASISELNLVPQELSRVLINLLNNAFYAVTTRRKQDKAHEPQVTVRTRNLGDAVEVRIEDNGPGIPEHVRQRMFEPFFTTKPPGQGTGLGLSLSYDIITNGYGGTLEEQGTEGQGAAFVIRLPTKPGAARGELTARLTPPRASAARGG